MDITTYKRLFVELNNLSSQLEYENELIRFSEFVDFYFYLDAHHKNLLYEDPNYLHFENLRENLKDLGEAYYQFCATYKTWSYKEDIIYLDEPVTDILLDLYQYFREKEVNEVKEINVNDDITAAVKKGISDALKPTKSNNSVNERIKPYEIALKYELQMKIKDEKSNKKSNI